MGARRKLVPTLLIGSGDFDAGPARLLFSGRAFCTSSGVHSGFPASGRLAFFRIRAFFSLVRSPQTDDPDRLASWRDHCGVKSPVDRAQHAQSSFTVILAGVFDGDRRFEVHVGEPGMLAILTQRLGTVSALPSTWHGLVRKYGWRRPGSPA
jgi:hypothetical protein